jgi:hypothetical protein
MEAVPVQLDEDLIELIDELQRPPNQAARELIVLELLSPAGSVQRKGRAAAWDGA